jgi:hypothetical protein
MLSYDKQKEDRNMRCKEIVDETAQEKTEEPVVKKPKVRGKISKSKTPRIIEYADLTDKQKEIVDACDEQGTVIPRNLSFEEFQIYIRRKNND